MKKIYAIILTFIIAINLYCFDLIEDTFDFIFDDLAQLIIAVVIFFVRKYLNKKNSDKGN